MERSRIFAIPILDRWLIHAPLHDSTALVNDAALAQLRSGAVEETSPLAELCRALSGPPVHSPKVKDLSLPKSFAFSDFCFLP